MRCTLILAFAALAQATPISITGGGHWWYDHTIGGGEGWTVQFAGSSGERFVSLSGDCAGALSWCRLDNLFMPAEIDGAFFRLGSVSFALGASGWITGRDAQGLSVTEAINGVWTETSRICYAPNACEGSFAIVPALVQVTSNPEPGSMALVLAGLGITYFRKRRRC